VKNRSRKEVIACFFVQVAKALLSGSGTMEKALVPTIDGEGKPPVRLQVLDSEEQEATVIAQV
jgi:hypothetical protein